MMQNQELVGMIQLLPEDKRVEVENWIQLLAQENHNQWFSVRSLFRHDGLSSRPGRTVYEERIVLFNASNSEEALVKAEKEAKEYATSLERVVMLKFCESFRLFDDLVGESTEVFSLMRESLLGDDDFVDAYFDDGTECRQPFNSHD